MSDGFDVMPINPLQLARLSHFNKDKDLPKPFEQKIFLAKRLVAGTSHLQGVEELDKRLNIGAPIKMYRETKNEHDDLAVLLKFVEGDKETKIGYLARRENDVFARLLDAGKNLTAEVDEKEWRGNWLKIFLKIYLEE